MDSKIIFLLIVSLFALKIDGKVVGSNCTSSGAYFKNLQCEFKTDADGRTLVTIGFEILKKIKSVYVCDEISKFFLFVFPHFIASSSGLILHVIQEWPKVERSDEIWENWRLYGSLNCQEIASSWPNRRCLHVIVPNISSLMSNPNWPLPDGKSRNFTIRWES